MTDETIAALIGVVSGVVGATVGAIATSWQFKRQRGFERQLDWYERIVAAMHDMAQSIEIGCTFQRERADTELLNKVWRDVQNKHLALDTVVHQAPIFGSATANNAVTDLVELLDAAADETEAFDLAQRSNEKLLNIVEDLADELRARAHPLAREARQHLRIR